MLRLSDPNLSPSQKRARVTVLLVVTVLISVLAYRFVPLEAPTAAAATTLVDKLVFTLRWQVLSFMTLLVGINIVAITRFYTPAINPMDKAGAPYVEAYNRCLQNTLEQLVLNVPGQLVLSTFLDGADLKLIPYLVCLFVLGRVLFWVGYPFYRSPGYALTFFPTMFTYCLNLYYMASLGVSFQLGKR